MDWNLGAAASLVDMNGDGLGDVAFITREIDGRVFLGVRYWPGDGRGNFTACTSDSCQCTSNGFETPSIVDIFGPGEGVDGLSLGVLVAAPIAANLILGALSRKREYQADLEAAH